jgi:hypothetical protein
MRRIASLLLFFAAANLQAQPKSSDPHEHDFDYLLGDWEFTADSSEWGKSHGFWSAVRLETGQIIDQYRVTGDTGETYASTITLRAYNAARKEWELVSTNTNNGLRDSGTAHRDGNEMRLEQTFGASTKRPFVWHIRYHDIAADHFLWDGDCSSDAGKTWNRCLHIEAHRIGPPRSLGSLAPTMKAR